MKCTCKFWNRKIKGKTHVVCIKDNYSTNRWSQLDNNFAEYAFIVNLASIRSFEGYNVA
jgi:hypothetical protein